MRLIPGIPFLILGFSVMTACSDDAPDPRGGSGGTSSGGTQPGGTGATSSGGQATGGSTSSGGSSTGGSSSLDCGNTYLTSEQAGLTIGIGTYDYADSGGSCIAMTAENGRLCAKGEAALVENSMWDTIWGAGMGVHFMAGGSIDASEYDGFSFTISNPPDGLRVGALMEGDPNSYFTIEVVEGENFVAFADLENGEWISAPGTFDPAMLSDIQWHIPTNDAAPVAFDFCVGELTLDESNGMGGMGGMGGTLN